MGRWRQALVVALAVILVAAATISSPWWYSWLLWRPGSTSYVFPGPGINPETLAVVDALAVEVSARIPRIIHQTWKDDNIPPEWRGAQAACKALHPEYEFKLWTDESARAFIAERFPELLPTWDAYPYVIQQADVIRYAVLQVYGGFYIDLDIECLKPLDFLRQNPFVMPQTRPVGFSNDFLAAAPAHPFVEKMLRALPGWRLNLLTKYPTVMFSTGPMFVTLQANTYANRRGLWVLPDELYSKYVRGGPRAVFNHLHGSSWHGDDAKSVLWFVHHPMFVGLVLLCCTCTVGLYAWRSLAWGARAGGAKPRPPYTQLTEVKLS